MGDTSIKIDNTTYAEAPPIITPDIAIFWDPASKELLMQIEGGDKEAMTLSRKARTFLKCKCIEKQGDKYICKPIQGYNQTTYTIDLENQQCNCQ